MSDLVSISLWVLAITLFTGGFYWLCCKGGCCQCVNRLADCYLDRKYRNYQVVKPEAVDYQLTKIDLILIPDQKHFTLTTPNDLNVKNLDISHMQLCEQYSDFKAIIRQYPKTILIHLQYAGQPYTLPIQFNEQGRLKLPFYTADDLASCLKTEYSEIKTKSKTLSPDAILQYAGPKGNFYCDTPYQITPAQLPSLLSNDPDDFLQLTTIFGDTYRFNRDEVIKIT